MTNEEEILGFLLADKIADGVTFIHVNEGEVVYIPEKKRLITPIMSGLCADCVLYKLPETFCGTIANNMLNSCAFTDVDISASKLLSQEKAA